MSTNIAQFLPEDPFVRLPSRKELVLFLIGRELKNTRLLGKLGQVGFDTDSYCTDAKHCVSISARSSSP